MRKQTQNFLFSLLAATAVFCAAAPPQPSPAEGDEAAGIQRDGRGGGVREMHSAISTLNLINGLNLDREQTQTLLRLNQRARELKNSRDAACSERDGKDAGKAMSDLRDFLVANPEKDNKNLQSAAAAKFRGLKESSDAAAEKYFTGMSKLAAEAEAALSPEQLEVVSTFKPCIVPPQNMRNPVRAGQAQDPGPGMKMLSELRKLKDKPAALNHAIEKSAAKVAEFDAKHGPAMSAADTERRANELRETLKSACAMSDTDFELKKQEIAKKLFPVKNEADPASVKAAAGAQKRVSGSKAASAAVDLRSSKTARFLLNPDVMIPALEARLKAPADGGLR
jgi:hypothetical protein